MSVAAYSPGSQMEMYYLLKGHQLPIDPAWSHDQKVAALEVYVCALAGLHAEETGGVVQDCEAWIRALLNQRFQPLEDPQNQNRIEDGWVESLHRHRRHFAAVTRELNMPAQLTRQLREHALRLQSRVQGFALRIGGVDPAIWTTELQSLIEDLVNSVLGTEMVEPFFQYAAGLLDVQQPGNNQG